MTHATMIHRSAASIASLMLLTSVALSAGAVEPKADTQIGRQVRLVFDTDMGNDVDDALALGVIHALASRGECELAAVTITKDEPLSAPFVDAVNTFYGRGDIPIGVVRQGFTKEPSKFTILANAKDGDALRYPHDLASGNDAPEAVRLLRTTLAAAEDGSIVVVQVGLSTNLARLLESTADDASELSGVELVRKKVRLLSIMAGDFTKTDGSTHPEYNVRMDVDSARKLVKDWPTEVVFSGFEIGIALTYPSESIEKDFAYAPHHPVAEAYVLYNPPPHDRPLWDLTSVLYAVRPDGGYFDLSPPGQVQVADNGATSFEPKAAGKHRFLVLNSQQRDRARKLFVELASQPPTSPEENR